MMDPKELMAEAAVLEPQLQNWRRTLHRHPEVGFDLPQTRALVKQALTEMGYTPQDCGKAGILVLAGGKKPGKTILLRGDMDALPVQEESGVDFASEVPGRMHGCGHDMHTAMMLGAAKLLKAHEEELEGTVKLEFQPAEEIFQAPGYDRQRPAGKPEGGCGGHVPCVGWYASALRHGSGAGRRHHDGQLRAVPHHRPWQGRPRLHARSLHRPHHGGGAHPHRAAGDQQPGDGPHSFGVFTTGRFQAGAASNVIPDTAEMWGTIRTIDPENKVGELIHKRMTEIAQGVAAAYRCTAEVGFSDYCPCMVVDHALAGNAMTYMTELVGQGAMDMSKLTGGKPGRRQRGLRLRQPRGAHRQHVPCRRATPRRAYAYGQHHPKVKFDDSILYEAARPTAGLLCAG